MATKNYAVLVTEEAADKLAVFAAAFLTRDKVGCYFYAKQIDPNGAYFHMTLESDAADRKSPDFELQIPHSFVVAVFYSADLKQLGFTSAP